MLDASWACRKSLLDVRESIWTDLEESAVDALKIRVSGVRFPLWPFYLTLFLGVRCLLVGHPIAGGFFSYT